MQSRVAPPRYNKHSLQLTPRPKVKLGRYRHDSPRNDRDFVIIVSIEDTFFGLDMTEDEYTRLVPDCYSKFAIKFFNVSLADPETWGGGGAINMKYKLPRMATIFCTLFCTGQGGMAPLPPPPLLWIRYFLF